VISLGGIVVSRSIRIGGDEMDQDIVAFARREYNLFLGERTAEDIKIAVGSAYPGEWDSQRVTLRGRDLLTGPAALVEVGADQIREAIEPSVAADRRHDQGHDRGDAARARRRHHGPGDRARRRRGAARRPGPARRRGHPDARPRRGRPADLRRPRARASCSRSSTPRWTASSSPTPTAARRARPRGSTRLAGDRSTDRCHVHPPRQPPGPRRGIAFVILLATSLVLMAFSANPRPRGAPARHLVRVRPFQRRARRSAGGFAVVAAAISEIDRLRTTTRRSARRTSGSGTTTPVSRSSAARTSSSPGCSRRAGPGPRDRRRPGHRARDRRGPPRRDARQGDGRRDRAKGDVVVAQGGALAGPGRRRRAQLREGHADHDGSSTVIGQLVSSAATGEVVGQLGGVLIMDKIDSAVQIDIGEEVFTAGIELGGRIRSPYPQGLVIGRVVDVERDANAVVQTAFLAARHGPRHASSSRSSSSTTRAASRAATSPRARCRATSSRSFTRTSRNPPRHGAAVPAGRPPGTRTERPCTRTVALDEGPRPRRRHGDPALPAHDRHQQAPAADLRPADDLLPARDARGMGIREVMVVVGGQERRRHRGAARRRRHFGLDLTYRYQRGALGIAHAIGLARDFVGDESVLRASSATTSCAGRRWSRRPSSRRARGAPARSSTASRTRSASASRSSTRTGTVVASRRSRAPEERPHPDRRLLPAAGCVRRHRPPRSVGPRRVRDHRRPQPLHPDGWPVHARVRGPVDGRGHRRQPPARGELAEADAAAGLLPPPPQRPTPVTAPRVGAHLLVTGGAGFIGSASSATSSAGATGRRITVLDKLTYAGNRANLAPVRGPRAAARLDVRARRHRDPEVRSDALVAGADAVVNFAAESHVDRSILDPEAFLRTGVIGVHVLLEAVRERPHGRPAARPAASSRSRPTRSTATSERAARARTTRLRPRSPYAAAKAAGELLVRAYHVTHGLDVPSSPAARTPTVRTSTREAHPALRHQRARRPAPAPLRRRAAAPRLAPRRRPRGRRSSSCSTTAPRRGVQRPGSARAPEPRGRPRILDPGGKPWSLVRTVAGPARPRPALRDGRRASLAALGWAPRSPFDEGLPDTVAWYRDHEPWWRSARGAEWDAYYARQYGERLAGSAPADAPAGAAGAGA
jgi:dTDP-glucose 4,6-dehydratase